MAIVSPIGFVRAAVKTQLADVTKGLNPNLATYAAAYGVTAWSFDFGATSRNFFEANIDYPQTEETDIPQKNLLTLYGARAIPFPDNDPRRIFNAAFSGMVEITLDMYVGVLGERIRNFDWYVDTATAAMLATMNNVSNQNGLNAGDATRNEKVHDLELTAVPGKCQYDGENWIIPIRFTTGFGVIIP
jgi:hypothetical protein